MPTEHTPSAPTAPIPPTRSIAANTLSRAPIPFNSRSMHFEPTHWCPLAAETPPALSEGQTFGSYAVLRFLGRGGMGETYLVSGPLPIQSRRVLKIIPPRYATSDHRLRLFQNEAQALADLRHPNIALFHDYFIDRPTGCHAIVMDFAQGQPLSARLAAGPLPLQSALSCLTDLADALATAHAAGILHRDLKPSNIIITDDGRAVLIDFGLARIRFIDLPDSNSTPTDGRVIGTPGYMAPEQIRGEPHGPQTDVFAFGLVLFECLTGQMAFRADSENARIARTLEDEPDFSTLPAATPPHVRDLLRRCLIKRRDLRLKDITEARAILRSGARPPAPIAEPPTTFIGRAAELAAIDRLFDSARLITLTGPGGCGKTRLALRTAALAAARFGEPPAVIDLTAVADPAAVAPAVARALNIPHQPGRDDSELVAAAIADRRLLILLDNCDRLLAPCAALAHDLLRRCPGLAILATSRERLGAPGEQLFDVPPLPCPDTALPVSVESAASSEAVQLFSDRLRRYRHDFRLTAETAPQVASLCTLLGGLPLAIELVAARLRAIPLKDALSRVGEWRASPAAAPSPNAGRAHHTSMHACIAWSEALLEDADKRLFRRLAVFRAGWTLEAAEAVGADELLPADSILERLTGLVDKSLVRFSFESSRYRLLEPIREYAAARLRDDPPDFLEALALRHARFYSRLAADAAPHLSAEHSSLWMNTLDAEHDNLRAAFDILLATHPADAARLADSLHIYWYHRGHLREGRDRLSRAIDACPHSETATLAAALNAMGTICLGLHDNTRAAENYTKSLDLWRSLGNRAQTARLLNNLGIVHQRTGRNDQSRAAYNEAEQIYESLGERHEVACVQLNLTALHIVLSGDARADGRFDLAEQHASAAKDYLKRCMDCFNATQDRARIASCLSNMAELGRDDGDARGALRLLARSFTLRVELALRTGIPRVLVLAADCRRMLGDFVAAASLIGAARERQSRVASDVVPGGDSAKWDRLCAHVSAELGEHRFRLLTDAAAQLPDDMLSSLVDPEMNT